ncbi:Methyl-accepting chemotaxis protein 4 [Pannonibacter phragmitetus]|uniref:Methyl-accepting chemotaxis protein 4 n=2 Tax=Pannonibacter phragmitetus TaxID=121719 RepID=A0A378ZTG9_9HYPH|nr:Methyl-accepting chemotaxis protein 4 [Pannonibacter phragmitetus]
MRPHFSSKLFSKPHKPEAANELVQNRQVDIPADTQEDRDEALHRIGNAIDMIETDLRRATAQVSAETEDLRNLLSSQQDTLKTIRVDALDLQSEAGKATGTMSELAASIEELAGSSGQIGALVERSGQLAQDATGAATEANSGVLELTAAISDIANVVRLISGIAKQTNLLALNATIEAARAGDAGRGFAVVASEVKALSVETQKATEEIVSKIERLQASADLSTTSVSRIIDAVAELRPSFAEVENAIREQVATTSDISQRANQTAAFIDEVGKRISTINDSVSRAEESGTSVHGAVGKMAASVSALGPRFTMMLRQSPAGDRRVEDRLPCRINGTLALAGQTAAVEARDISHAGVLLKTGNGPHIAAPASARLSLDGVGQIDLRIVNRSDNGLHCQFSRMDDMTGAALDKLIHGIQARNATAVNRAQEGAARISEAMQKLVDNGRLTRDALFDTDYKIIQGSNPVQYSNRALAQLEQILPQIQDAILAQDTAMTFCVAIDRNGYLPVHNKAYSHPQRPDDPVWNAANCRNKRIFDDRAGLSAARNTRPVLVQSYARDMGNGNVVWLQEVDAPITVCGIHWGGFRTAYRL